MLDMSSFQRRRRTLRVSRCVLEGHRAGEVCPVVPVVSIHRAHDPAARIGGGDDYVQLPRRDEQASSLRSSSARSREHPKINPSPCERSHREKERSLCIVGRDLRQQVLGGGEHGLDDLRTGRRSRR